MILFVSLVFGIILCLVALVMWVNNIIQAAKCDDISTGIVGFIFILLMATMIGINTLHIVKMFIPNFMQEETIEVEEDIQPKVEEDLVI